MTVLNDPLVRRIVLPLLMGTFALLVVVGTSLWLTVRTTDDTAQVVKERHWRQLGAQLLDLLQDMETGHRGYLLTHDPKFLEPYQASQPKVAEVLARIQELRTSNPAAIPKLNQLSKGVADKLQEMSETLEAAQAGRFDPSQTMASLDRGKAAMDSVRQALATIIDQSGARISQRLSGIQQNATLLTWVSVVASLLIFFVIGAAIWATTQYTRDLVEARNSIEAANASLEERVNERTLDLTRANEEIQRYAYIVTHDLRAPLVNIVGFTSELDASLQTLRQYITAVANGNTEPPVAASDVQTMIDQDVPEAIEFIRASTAKMDLLINAILKLSREGRRQLRPERLDLNTVMANIFASVQHQLEEKNIEVKVDDDLPIIFSDRLGIEQIFGNLVDNAVKYLSPDRSGEIRVSMTDRSSFVEIDVADNGRGIAAADHERIFELFRRSGAQSVKGEGIGLAHVRTMVRRMGGDITVESEIGRGSRFKVRLPKYLRVVAESKDI
jgi:signal transduction histidine kinase